MLRLFNLIDIQKKYGSDNKEKSYKIGGRKPGAKQESGQDHG